MRSKAFSACAVVLLIPAAAQAYTDAGTGAYLIQTLFALTGALMFYAHPVRLFRRVLRWVDMRRGVRPTENALPRDDRKG